MKFYHLVLTIAAFILVFVYFYFNPNSMLFPKCPLYSTTGIYCPGCGSQRALHSLLHLNFREVIQYNVLFLAGILLGIYHYTIALLNHFYNKKYTSILSNKKTLLFLLGIVILFWILRNIPTYPFTLLAPK